MYIQKYKNQLGLLLRVLPYVSQTDCFALKGGTAINLFVRDMPRLSVDIDLTYLPVEDRHTSLRNIGDALKQIKHGIENQIPNSQVSYKPDVGKLVIRTGKDEIKIEVNLVGRGSIKPPKKMMLCDKAQNIFDTSSVINVISLGELYGGKICASLDRQHPRDLFDIKILMENEGFPDEVREGFLFCLLCSNRPINELLAPNFQDQRQAMDNQFIGMSNIDFSYDDYEKTREQLVKTIHNNLTDNDKEFLLSVKNCEPDWGIYDFERFPAVQWKLRNLYKLKKSNPYKHKQLYEVLRKKLYECSRIQ